MPYAYQRSKVYPINADNSKTSISKERKAREFYTRVIDEGTIVRNHGFQVRIL